MVHHSVALMVYILVRRVKTSGNCLQQLHRIGRGVWVFSLSLRIPGISLLQHTYSLQGQSPLKPSSSHSNGIQWVTLLTYLLDNLCLVQINIVSKKAYIASCYTVLTPSELVLLPPPLFSSYNGGSSSDNQRSFPRREGADEDGTHR